MSESHFTPISDRDVEETVRGGMAKARKQSEIKLPPTREQVKRRRRMLGIGVGIMATLAFFGVKKAEQAHQQDALNSELAQPAAKVKADLVAGEINPGDVTKFKVGDTEYAWSVASDLTRQDHEGDTGTVESIVIAQQGNPVEAGSTVIVPNSEIDPQPQPQTQPQK